MDSEIDQPKRSWPQRLLALTAIVLVLGWGGIVLFAPPRTIELVTGILLLLVGLLLMSDNQGAVLRKFITAWPMDAPLLPIPRPLVWSLSFFLCFVGALFLIGGFTVRVGGLLPSL